SGIPDLKERALSKAPCGRGLPCPFDHGAGSIQSDRIEVFILPQHLEADETNASPDVENHSTFETQSEGSLNKIVFQFGWIFQRTGINEGVDLFRRLEFGRFDASRMRKAGEEAH